MVETLRWSLESRVDEIEYLRAFGFHVGESNEKRAIKFAAEEEKKRCRTRFSRAISGTTTLVITKA